MNRLLTILLVLPATFAFAEEPTWSIGTFVEAPTHSFVIATETGESNYSANAQRVQYNPTYAPNLGMRASYKGSLLSYSRKMVSDADPDVYGRSTYEDFHTRWRANRFLSLHGFYQNYQSFYADLNGHEGLKSSFSKTDGTEQQDQDTTVPSTFYADPIVKRSDLGVEWVGGGMTLHIPFVPFLNAFEQDASKRLPDNFHFDLVLRGQYSQLEIAGEESLVPEALQTALEPAARLKSIEASTLRGGMGLETSYGGESGYFRFGGSGGSGFQNQTRHLLVGGTEREDGSKVDFVDMHLGFGWNSGIHQFGFDFLLDALSSEVSDIKITSNRLAALASYDLRL